MIKRNVKPRDVTLALPAADARYRLSFFDTKLGKVVGGISARSSGGTLAFPIRGLEADVAIALTAG